MRRALTWLLPVLALLWLAPRFLPGGSALTPAVRSTIASLDVRPSERIGRFGIRGPAAEEDPTGLLALPESRAARHRLQSAVDRENEELGLLAQEIAGCIESYPTEGVTGLRLSGMIVPFYDQDAVRLARAREEAMSRPHASLRTVVAIVDVRLSEPDHGLSLEEGTRRRELTRLSRDTRARLEDAEIRLGDAVTRFRAELVGAARHAEGPFRRRGPGRIAEMVLASLFGVVLALALRPPRDATVGWITLAVAPTVATGAVLLAEGTNLLPVDPVGGTAPRFVGFSFFLGIWIPLVIWAASPVPPAPRREPRRSAAAARTALPAERQAVTGPAPATEPEPRPAPSPSRANAPSRTTAPARPPTERELPTQRFFVSAPVRRVPPVTRRADPGRPVPSRLPFARKRRRP